MIKETSILVLFLNRADKQVGDYQVNVRAGNRQVS
jgi:hypothetical protein